MTHDDRSTRHASGLILTCAALMAIGIVMIATTTSGRDIASPQTSLWTGAFIRQLAFIGIGFAVILTTPLWTGPLLRSPDWRFRAALVLFGVVIAALVLAWLPGFADPRRGSNRWLNLTSLGVSTGVQPSEFAKPALAILLAVLLSRFDPKSLKQGLVPAAGAIALCVLLIGSADFGTSTILAGIGAAMLIAAGCRWRYLLVGAGLGFSGMVGLILAEPYRLKRITAFRSVWEDTQGAAYQPFQSLVTIASGGWFGQGLGAGVQKHGYLPEVHTDFIFAIICEETGVVGAVLVIGLVSALAWSGLTIMRDARDSFSRLLALGLTVSLVLQALMNLAVVTVMTPTTGISLPFISAGGSGMLSACLSVGLLCAVARGSGQSMAYDRRALLRESARPAGLTPRSVPSV